MLSFYKSSSSPIISPKVNRYPDDYCFIPPEGAKFAGNKGIVLYKTFIPFDISRAFGGRHDYYNEDLKSYRHLVDPYDLPKDIAWRFRWMPEVMDLVLNHVDFKLYIKNKTYRRTIDDEISIAEFNNGYRGEGLDGFLDVLSQNEMSVTKAYKRLRELSDTMPELRLMRSANMFIPYTIVYLQNGEDLMSISAKRIYFN